MRNLVAALLIMLASQHGVWAQAVPAVSTASSPLAFPQLPLKRDSSPETSTVESLGWAAMLLVAIVAAGFVAIRHKTIGRPLRHLLYPAGKTGAPRPVGRALLTQQASLHVVEWNGEELLLGCTPHAISLIDRRPSDSYDVRSAASTQGKA